MSAQSDLVLYASFLQNRKSQTRTSDLSTTSSPRAQEMLLSSQTILNFPLKDAQLQDLKELWDNTSFPALTIADFIKYHNVYTEELMELENKRLLANSNYLIDE